MSTTKNGVLTPIVDKNGKRTSVIKKNPNATKPTRSLPVAFINAALVSDSPHAKAETVALVTDRRTLNRLARDTDQVVAGSAQASGNLTGADYDKLFDEEKIIDYAALESETALDMEPNKLRTMINTGDTATRLQAARIYKLDEEILVSLSQDKNASVVRSALKSLERHRNFAERVRTNDAIAAKIDETFAAHDIWVNSDWENKIKKTLLDANQDGNFYKKEDAALDSIRSSDRFNNINELIGVARMSRSALSTPDEYVADAEMLLQDLFKKAHLEHELPYDLRY